MIVMCTDGTDTYISQLKTSINSIFKNSPGIGIEVHLINCDKKIINTLKDEYPTVYFVEVYDPSLNKSEIASYSSMATYMALKRTKGPVIFIDCDTIIRKNISCLFEDIEGNELKLFIRPKHRGGIASAYNTGVYVVGYSESTMALMHNWWMEAKGKKDWLSDQTTLWYEYHKMEDQIKLTHLERKYNDFGGRPISFNEDSYIWHCKAKHFKNKIYQSEYKKYE